MQRFFILVSFVLISAAAAQAQATAVDQKPLLERKQVESVKCLEDNDGIKAVVSTPARTNLKTKEQLTGASVVSAGRVLRLGPTTTYLKEGLSTEEVLRILGKPATRSERQEGQTLFSVYTFERSEGRRLVAEFENNILVRSRTESPEGLALSK